MVAVVVVVVVVGFGVRELEQSGAGGAERAEVKGMG